MPTYLGMSGGGGGSGALRQLRAIHSSTCISSMHRMEEGNQWIQLARLPPPLASSKPQYLVEGGRIPWSKYHRHFSV